MSATELTNGTHVTLTTTLPGIPTGTHGTVHGSWATHTGVIFDTNPGYIRYVPPTVLRIDHPETLDDVELTTPERISFYAIAHHHDDEHTPCNYTDSTTTNQCPTPAVWWYECRCGTIMLGCEPHRARYDAWNSRTRDHGKRLQCSTCKMTRPEPLPWRAL